MAQPNLNSQERFSAIEALNRWRAQSAGQEGGTQKIPEPAWHLINAFAPLRGAPHLPFAAYDDLVAELFELLKKGPPTDESATAAMQQVWAAKLYAREKELTPAYPELQDYRANYH